MLVHLNEPILVTLLPSQYYILNANPNVVHNRNIKRFYAVIRASNNHSLISLSIIAISLCLY